MATDTRYHLPEDLERALLGQLSQAWRTFNHRHFEAALRPPALRLDDAQRRLGQYSPDTRCLSLSRDLVLKHPWGEVLEVLKHEMAHQYVVEVLRVSEPPHGPSFHRVCEEAGLDASATGLPQAPPAYNRVVDRVRKLLALADSPNEHEAQAAMNTAQRLMLKHNIRAVSGALGSEGAGDCCHRQLGEVRSAVPAHEKVLGGILAEHFFVECLWVGSYDVFTGRSGRVLEVMGTRANVEIAAWVHGYLLETCQRLWRQHQRQHRVRGNRDRRRYFVGVLSGFRHKLAGQAQKHQEEGLVWVGDPRVEAWSRRRYPHRSSMAGAQVRVDQTFRHGEAAGQTIVLRKPVGGEPTSGGRLLG